MSNKERLARLVDDLPEDIAGEVLDFAEYLKDKQRRILAAFNALPIDDEPVSEEENRIADQAIKDAIHGEALTSIEAKRRLLA